jgi:hypothetical protein
MSASPVDAASSLTPATTTSAGAACPRDVDAGIRPIRWSEHEYDRRFVRRPPRRAQMAALGRVLKILGAGSAVTACRMGMLMGRPPYTAWSIDREVAGMPWVGNGVDGTFEAPGVGRLPSLR